MPYNRTVIVAQKKAPKFIFFSCACTQQLHPVHYERRGSFVGVSSTLLYVRGLAALGTHFEVVRVGSNRTL